VPDEVPTTLPAALAYTLGGDQGVQNPDLAERYRLGHEKKGAKFALDYEDVMSKRQAEVENAKRILDETAAALRAGHTGEGPGQMNLPLLQMAAGFFKPTRSGNFGEEFGNALSGLAGGIGKQRMGDDEFNRGMADLTLKRSSFEQEPMKDRAALLKAQQLQEEKAQQAIEVAQMKTSPTQGMSPLAKLRRDRDLKLISEEEYQAALAKMTQVGGGGSADTQAYNAALQYHVDHGGKKEDFPSNDVWKVNREKEIAKGKETGKEQAKVAQTIPTLQATTEEANRLIEEMVVHPGMKNAVGVLWATAPGIPGQPKADFEAIEGNLLGRVFMRAYEALKGAGAITEAEGLKATASELPTSRKQSKEAYIRNLRQYQKWLEKGLEIANEKAGKAPTQQAPTQQTTPPAGPWSKFGGGG
jgi:hypothetical protein